MASDSYIVIRLVPDSPVDGATFSSYLDGLQIQVFPANAPSGTAALGETQLAAGSYPGLALIQVPWLSNTYVASVSKVVETPTQLSSGKYGTNLVLADGNGVAFAATVTCPANTSLFTGNMSVSSVVESANNATVSFSPTTIPNFVAAGTVVTASFAYGPGSNDSNAPSISATYTGSNPSFSFSLPVSGNVSSSTTVAFTATDGIAVGMQVTLAAASAGSSIPANTTVTAVTSGTSITLSNPVTLVTPVQVTFTTELNSGIVQHVEPFDEFTLFYVPVLVSVATAVITIPSPPVNTYLDISVVATRNGVAIPLQSAFYNVNYAPGTPPTPDQYQAIPLQQTSLYIALPAPPGANTIGLPIPTDGTPPSFDSLYPAMQQALLNDPAYFSATTDLSTLSAEDCTRMAYDIVWGQQNNTLPTPPDPLESLYTNPPNPGGSTSSGSSGSNYLETDRQKFEGTLSSFYSTPNANTERLTKFIAAASAAIYCEQTSLNATSALLEFPVNPSSTFATEVESELLVQGLGLSSASGLNFGVPAAYFYALSANLDKSTTAQQRFQQATGDTIERLLQQFTTAVNTNVLDPRDSEAFTSSGLTSVKISSFQAARRLVALAVSAASTSPSATVIATNPLAALVKDWLGTTDPTPTPPPNPPLTYQNTDFNIWTQQLASSDPQGYLYLDLDALTQGYVIPPFTASPTGASTSTTLTFATLDSNGIAIGIGVGMTVSGTNIAPGTTVTVVTTSGATTTVTLSSAALGSVTSVQFNGITAATTLDCPSGTTLTFANGATTGITSGMSVSGPNIVPGTLVSSVSDPTVTLNQRVSSDVPLGSIIIFVTNPSTLADQIFAWLPSTTSPTTPQPNVNTLMQVTATQWTNFFTNTGNPAWLPPFTQPVAPGGLPDTNRT